MADTYQFANTPLPSDMACKNYGVTDIPAYTAVLLDTTAANLVPTADAFGIVNPTAAASIPYCIGVTMQIIHAGETGSVRTQGVVQMIAAGTVTAGDVVQCSTTAAKLGWGMTQASAQPQLGQALTTATNSNTFLCQLSRAKNA